MSSGTTSEGPGAGGQERPSSRRYPVPAVATLDDCLGEWSFGGEWGYLTDGMRVSQLGARYYWPEIGRFVTQDPIGDGMNWYAYVGNNPVVWVDPEGLEGGFWAWVAGQARAVSDVLNGLGPMAIQPFLMDPDDLPTFAQRNPGLGDLQRCIGRGEGFDPVPAFGGLVNAGLGAGLAAFVGPDWPDPGSVLPEALAEAQGRYPKLAGRLNNHHWDPMHLGGDKAGPTGGIDAALHQAITNANRARFAYGRGIKPSLSKRLPLLLEILRGFFKF